MERTFNRFTAALVLALAVGCAGSPPPPTEEPSIPGDEKVLDFLDCYHPAYRLDAEGRVTDLILQGRHVLAPVLVEVGKLTELQRLNLVSASLTDDSLANLRGLKKLKVLRLGSTPISDKGLIHLEGLQELAHLYCPFTNVTPQGAKKLKSSLPRVIVHLK